MVIDFHTHTYPPRIAEAVIQRLAGPSHIQAFTDATAAGLEEACRKNEIETCVVLPVVTDPRQTASINRAAAETNQRAGHLVSFGGIHPDNSDYRQIMASLAAEGFRGIKLHPYFQKTDFDDIRYMRLVDAACSYGLMVSVHAGLDVNDPSARYSDVPHIQKLLMTVKPQGIILAHMGGHLRWDAAEEMLQEYLAAGSGETGLYLDTAFCLASPIAAQNLALPYLTREQFCRMVRLVGADHVLFGTDSPWTDHAASIRSIRESGLTEKEISRILYENGRDLLKPGSEKN